VNGNENENRRAAKFAALTYRFLVERSKPCDASHAGGPGLACFASAFGLVPDRRATARRDFRANQSPASVIPKRRRYRGAAEGDISYRDSPFRASVKKPARGASNTPDLVTLGRASGCRAQHLGGKPCPNNPCILKPSSNTVKATP
jgi:hypothetical protein